jgi:hypothetical protein
LIWCKMKLYICGCCVTRPLSTTQSLPSTPMSNITFLAHLSDFCANNLIQIGSLFT